MRFQTSDPDVESILRRIDRKGIDLQPDFQRGEVWSRGKKQRLIDTILRKWHVPPIHLVAQGNGKFDVLDGQQRLISIRDFVRGDFAFDGYIEPLRPELAALDGLRFGQLPEGVREDFLSYAVRVFELHDYTPEEPHELFFRLNQPMVLTEAEKRNAFIGKARNQVKDLVEWASEHGLVPERLGFSNARMAYDDLIARFLLTLEQGGFLQKVTAMRITARYREHNPFSDQVMATARTSLGLFLSIDMQKPGVEDSIRARPNKATMHTWLCMVAKLKQEDLLSQLSEEIVNAIQKVEFWRASREAHTTLPEPFLQVFNDRATARVADVSSIQLRDLIGWLALNAEIEGEIAPAFISDVVHLREVHHTDLDRALVRFANAREWGVAGWL